METLVGPVGTRIECRVINKSFSKRFINGGLNERNYSADAGNHRD